MKHPRIPTNYSLHRAATGRLASGMDTSDLTKGKRQKVAQVQNIPKKLRDAFVPDPGYVMVGGDWAGIEWAIAMWFCSKLSGSNGLHLRLLDDFWEGKLDPHRYLAAHAFDCAEGEITGRQRQTCKAYTHGRTFGGTPIGLAREVGHPQRVGELVCRAHDRAFQTQEWQRSYYEQVKRCKYVQTPLGWRRYFWGWKPKPQEVLGTLVQATAADLCKWVLGKVMYYLDPSNAPPEVNAFVLGEVLTSTHDSMLLQVPEYQREIGVDFLQHQMEQPIPWLDGRQWRADVKAGMNWREVS